MLNLFQHLAGDNYQTLNRVQGDRLKEEFFMRVAMYYRNNDVRVEEMPVPKIGKGELLVKVMASGICGSDVMEWYRIKKLRGFWA